MLRSRGQKLFYGTEIMDKPPLTPAEPPRASMHLFRAEPGQLSEDRELQNRSSWRWRWSRKVPPSARSLARARTHTHTRAHHFPPIFASFIPHLLERVSGRASVKEPADQKKRSKERRKEGKKEGKEN